MVRREIRRVAGMLARARGDLALERVADGRSSRGRRWSMKALLGATLAAQMAGACSVAEVERLTEHMSLAVRRKLGLKRRLPDTTLR